MGEEGEACKSFWPYLPLGGVNGHGFGWTLVVGNGQEGLVCCCSRGHKESDMTE